MEIQVVQSPPLSDCLRGTRHTCAAVIVLTRGMKFVFKEAWWVLQYVIWWVIQACTGLLYGKPVVHVGVCMYWRVKCLYLRVNDEAFIQLCWWFYKGEDVLTHLSLCKVTAEWQVEFSTWQRVNHIKLREKATFRVNEKLRQICKLATSQHLAGETHLCHVLHPGKPAKSVTSLAANSSIMYLFCSKPCLKYSKYLLLRI